MRDKQPQWSEDRKVVWLIKQSTFRFCTLPLFAPYTMAHFGGSVKVKLGNVKKGITLWVLINLHLQKLTWQRCYQEDWCIHMQIATDTRSVHPNFYLVPTDTGGTLTNTFWWFRQELVTLADKYFCLIPTNTGGTCLAHSCWPSGALFSCNLGLAQI